MNPAVKLRRWQSSNDGHSYSAAHLYPVKPFVYVIANITAISGLLFG